MSKTIELTIVITDPMTTPQDTKTLPLLTDEVMDGHELVPDKWAPSGQRLTFRPMTREKVRDFYETSRQEDAAKIARLEGLVQEARASVAYTLKQVIAEKGDPLYHHGLLERIDAALSSALQRRL